MASHEMYWAVVGTAAPVIALANAVSLGDSYRISRSFDVLPSHSSHSLRESASTTRSLARSILILGNINFINQAAVFLLALINLATGANVIWPVWFAILVEISGLLILIPISINVGRLQYSFDQIVAEFDQIEAEREKAGYADTLTEAVAQILSIVAKSSTRRLTNRPRPRGSAMQPSRQRRGSRGQRQFRRRSE